MITEKEILRQIINILSINLQNDSDKRTGLLNGKMGIAVLFYHYARLTGKKQYDCFPDTFIEKIERHISMCPGKNIFEGSAGIGQGIDYIIKNGFIEADEDVLEDIDPVIKAMDNNDFIKETGIKVPLFSKGLYFLQRGNKEILINSLLETIHFIKSNPDIKIPLMYINSVVYIAVVSFKESDNKGLCNELLDLLYEFFIKNYNAEIESQDYFLLKKNISLMSGQQSLKWSKLILDEFKLIDVPDCYWIDFIFPEGERIQVDANEICIWVKNCLNQYDSDKMYIYKGMAGIGLAIINKLNKT